MHCKAIFHKIMINTPLFMIFLFSSYGCDNYEDSFKLTAPTPLVSTFTFPDIVVFEISQSAPVSPSIPSVDAQLSVNIKKLNPDITGDFVFIINLYNKTPFISENLGYSKLINVQEFESLEALSIDLGSSFKTPLRKDLVEVRILDSGLGNDAQSQSRGYYDGNCYLLHEGDTVLGARILGSVDYHGEINFEVKGVNEFRFIKGLTIDNDSNLEIYSNLVDSDGRVITPFHGSLKKEDNIVNGSIDVTLTNYDAIEVYITKSAL